MATNRPGRISSDAAATRAQVATLVPSSRLPTPTELNPVEAELFETTLATMPRAFFKAHDVPLLKAYTRHACNADLIAAQIHADLQTNHPITLRDLYKMLELEQRAMSSAATRLRITPQTSYQAKKSRNGPTGGDKKPWEVD